MDLDVTKAPVGILTTDLLDWQIEEFELRTAETPEMIVIRIDQTDTLLEQLKSWPGFKRILPRANGRVGQYKGIPVVVDA